IDGGVACADVAAGAEGRVGVLLRHGRDRAEHRVRGRVDGAAGLHVDPECGVPVHRYRGALVPARGADVGVDRRGDRAGDGVQPRRGRPTNIPDAGGVTASVGTRTATRRLHVRGFEILRQLRKVRIGYCPVSIVFLTVVLILLIPLVGLLRAVTVHLGAVWAVAPGQHLHNLVPGIVECE